MIDAELDHLKAIPFEAVAMTLGYQRLKGETGASLTMKNQAGDKVVARLDGQHWVYFSVHDREDHGSSLDFVQRRQGGSLGHARKALRAISGENPSFPTAQSVDLRAEPATVDPDHCYKETRKVWNSATWNPTPEYLLSRGLDRATLNDPIFKDCWRVDQSGNVLFPHHDHSGMCGYERRNAELKRFGPGVNKGLWRSANLWDVKTTEVVICEGPIDCVSHFALYGGSMAYVATGGSMGHRQLELLRLLFRRVIRSDRVWVTVGTDNDAGGDRMYEEIALIAPMRIHRATPIGKDFSDDLAWIVRENR